VAAGGTGASPVKLGPRYCNRPTRNAKTGAAFWSRRTLTSPGSSHWQDASGTRRRQHRASKSHWQDAGGVRGGCVTLSVMVVIADVSQGRSLWRPTLGYGVQPRCGNDSCDRVRNRPRSPVRGGGGHWRVASETGRRGVANGPHATPRLALLLVSTDVDIARHFSLAGCQWHAAEATLREQVSLAGCRWRPVRLCNAFSVMVGNADVSQGRSLWRPTQGYGVQPRCGKDSCIGIKKRARSPGQGGLARRVWPVRGPAIHLQA
jgi:hypothetical protein